MALVRAAAYTLRVPFATGLTITATVSKDDGAFAAATNSCAEIGSTGIYSLTLTASEMTADKVDVNLAPNTGDPKLATLVTDPATVALDAAYDAAKTAAQAGDAMTLTSAYDAAKSAAAAGAAMTLTAAYDAAKTAATQTSVDTVDGIVGAILEDTGTTIPALIAALPTSTSGTLVNQATRLDANGNIVASPAGTALGVATAGSSITAYLATDTAYATPIRTTTAAADGTWALYLPDGNYTLVVAKDGYYDGTEGDSVITRSVIVT